MTNMLLRLGLGGGGGWGVVVHCGLVIVTLQYPQTLIILVITKSPLIDSIFDLWNDMGEESWKATWLQYDC